MLRTFSLEQAEKTGDSCITNPIRYSLCTQYAYLDDYDSVLAHAQQISKHPAQQHLVQGSKLLLGLPRLGQSGTSWSKRHAVRPDRPKRACPLTEELPSLEGLEGHAFSVMTHVLADFQKLKQATEVRGDRKEVEKWAKKVLGYTIAFDLDTPMAAIIGLCLQSMTYATSGDIQNARNMLSNAVELTKNTQNIPKWSERFTSLTEFFIAYKEQKATHPQFGENILVSWTKRHPVGPVRRFGEINFFPNVCH